MLRYLGGRLLQLIPTVVGMSLLIFAMVRAMPGDSLTITAGDAGITPQQLAADRHKLGLDQPFLVQFWHFFSGLFRGDFGTSYLNGQSVASLVGHAIPITLELTILSTIFAVVVGMPLGILSAMRRNSVTDVVSRIGGLIGLSMPNFWVATLLLLLISTVFHWAPSVNPQPIWEAPLTNLEQMAIPAFAISLYLLAAVMRLTRASMLETLGEDYIRTARAKGASGRRIVFKHALRNSLIPVVSLIGAQMGNLMSGSTVVEVIFGFPGVGNTLVSAINTRDYPIIQFCAIFLAAVFVVLNLIVDILYGVIDPRIEH